jgi:tetratricopeptide (TPR) repeat protein
MGDYSAAVESLEEILKLDPTNPVGLSYMVGILTYEMEDSAALTTFVESYLRSNSGDADGLNNLAGALMRVDEYGQRRPELILAAAKAAFEACEGTNCVMLDTYAKALYQIGNLDEAIRIQTDAVNKASESEKDNLQKVLAYYKECKRLLDGGA